MGKNRRQQEKEMKQLKQIDIPRRLKIPLLGIFGVIALYTVIGFLVFPMVAKSVLTEQLSDLLKRPVSIEKIKTNPYVLSVTIKGLDVKDRDDKRFLSLDEFFINLQLSSLFKKAVVIHRVRMVKPYLRVVRTEKETFNFSDLTDRPGEDKAEKTAVPGFQVRNIVVVGGHFLFEDRVADRRHELADLQLTLPALSSLPVDEVVESRPNLTARLNGASVSLSGSVRPFAENRQARLNIDIRRFDLVPELVYLPVQLKAGIKSAVVHVDTTATYDEDGTGKPRVTVSGPVTLSEVKITDSTGAPLIDLAEFTVVASPADLLSGKVHLRSVTCRSLAMTLNRDDGGRLNLKDLIPKQGESSKPESKEGGTGTPLDIVVDSIRVDPARLMFSDRAADGLFQTTLDPVRLSVDRFTLQGDTPTDYTLSLQTESGEKLSLSGSFSAKPLRTEGRIELSGMAPSKYAPYYNGKVNFEVTKKGTLDVASSFRYEAGKEEPLVHLTDGSIRIDSLKLTDKSTKKKVMSVPILAIKGIEVDTSNKSIKLGHLASEKGYALFHRSKNGRVNLQHLFPTGPHKEVAKSTAEKSTPATPWQLIADQIRIRDYTVRYEDHQMPEPVLLDLDRISLQANPFTTAADRKSKISVATRWNRKGKIAAKGDVSINPVAADLSVKIDNLDIRSFQPYISQHLNAVVTGGEVNCEGKVDFKSDGTAPPSFTYTGDASIVRFASVDKVQSHDFVKWDSLTVSGMTAGLNPNRYLVEKMALNKYHTRIIILPDGTININHVIAGRRSEASADSPKPAEAGTGSVKQPAAKVAIHQIIIEDSTLKFTDLLNKPSFETNIQQLGGRISGLSSEKGAMADLSLQGVSQNTAPMEIRGRMNPFGDDRVVDLKLLFKDIELSPFSAYSGKYIGYLVQKGKLHLNLEYEMQKNKLKGKNLLVLDQLTLGEKVESPDATSLPVSFAISLLKDRSGRIEIDLPVAGDVKDPKFKIGKIIVRMIVNLFTKIITSPFAALGAAFGGNEQLSHVDFNPGGIEVPESGKKTLDTLVDALYERPALQLEIKGEVNPATDGDAIRKKRYEDLLKTEKLKLMTQAGQKAVPLNEVEIEETEQDQLADLAYRAAELPKPKEPPGKIKALPPEEIKKRLLTNIQVTEDDLRLLAHKRASRVKDYLLKNEKSDPAKVFVVEPDTDFNRKSKKHQNSRANFSLK